MNNKKVKSILTVTTILTLVAIVQPTCLGQRKSRGSNTAPPNTQRTYTNIRQVDFKNFDYGNRETSYAFEGETVRSVTVKLPK